MPTVPKPSEPFDPCRAWLGIDRADLADPFLVLGLAAGENDALRVLRAAESRLTRLKGLAAGEHHAAREALILRVEQAREAVLSRIAQGAPRAPGYSMPPPPRQTRAADDATVVLSDAPEAESAAEPVIRVRPPRPPRRRQSAAVWVSILAMLASVAAGAAFVWQQGRLDRQRQAARAAAKAAEREALGARPDADAAEGTDRPERDAGTRPAKPLRDDALVSSSPPPDRSTRPARPPTPRRDTPAPEAAPPAVAALGTAAPAADPAMEDMADEMADTEPMADTGEDPTEPSPDDPPPAADPAAGDASEVDDAVRGALAALREGDFDTADSVLASALEDAAAIPAKRRVSDWQGLARYARDFAGFRDKAVGDVRSGNEFDVNGKKVAVVEIDEKKFVYRFQGRNRTCPRDRIPAGITFAIVSAWFDARPDNQLFLGAWHATKPEPDADKARACWERAEKGGLSAEPLLRLLDDPALAAEADAPPGGGDDGM